MVVTFEEYTADLTQDELSYENLIKDAISFALKNGVELKSGALEDSINMELHLQGYNYHLSDTRLRKFVNHLRSTAQLPIIATSKGYKLSEEDKDIDLQILSGEQRARSILYSCEGLRRYKQKKNQGI